MKQKNRFCINFDEIGLVPIYDDYVLELLTSPPKKIGDQVLVRVIETGETRNLILLRSSGMFKNSTWLVGEAP